MQDHEPKPNYKRHDMVIKFDYFIRRKSDNKLMQILQTTLTEDEICEFVKSTLTAPITYSMDDGDGNGEYIFSDLYIDEVTGLH